MWFFKKKEKEVDPVIVKTSRELNKLLNQRMTSDSIVNLNNILRTFLKEKYKINRGQTIEEIIKIIKKKHMNKIIKENLLSVILLIYKAEYDSKEPITKKQLKEYIKQTKEVIISTK